ncbi:biotin synthase [Sphaerotilus microaerophilus]|nr:biotin synthase [Sphaerotilus sp. FB-5]
MATPPNDPTPALRRDVAPTRVDGPALQRHLRRAAAPWLHEEVARRMADRLGLLRRPPRRILDWGSDRITNQGASQAWSDQLLRQHCPQAELVALDAEGQPLPASAPSGWLKRLFSPALRAPGGVASAHGDLLWANMGLHWANDLPALLQRWHAALQVDGLLMFSCFGPDTLRELRGLYTRAGWGSPASAWIDMHDLGDALVHAGFADPVMDMETLTLTWDSPTALLAELRTLGANTDPARHAGLRTPRWRQRLEQALADGLRGADGRLHLTFEIIYGHALKPEPRVPVAAETSISLDAMRDMTRRRPAG